MPGHTRAFREERQFYRTLQINTLCGGERQTVRCVCDILCAVGENAATNRTQSIVVGLVDDHGAE